MINRILVLNGIRYKHFEIVTPTSDEAVTIYIDNKDKVFHCKKEDVEYIICVENASEINRGEIE